ncbi:MAG: DUF547 domain-containing protein [Marinirhabdus sp.]
MKKILVLVLPLLSFLAFEKNVQSTDLFFDAADAFLKMYVSNGKVDYGGISKNPEALHSILTMAEAINVNPANAETYKAFWINAYNLAVIKGIVDNYPLKSPLDKKGFFDVTQYKLGGTAITLNDIENKKLRAQFGDARFHFVLVCGAKGCPPLIAQAYRPKTLDGQLQQQTRRAVNNSSFIKVTGGKVALSEIFKWYREDFLKEAKTEIGFLNVYRKNKIAEGTKITYYPYNWQLNSL